MTKCEVLQYYGIKNMEGARRSKRVASRTRRARKCFAKKASLPLLPEGVPLAGCDETPDAACLLLGLLLEWDEEDEEAVAEAAAQMARAFLISLLGSGVVEPPGDVTSIAVDTELPPSTSLSAVSITVVDVTISSDLSLWWRLLLLRVVMRFVLIWTAMLSGSV